MFKLGRIIPTLILLALLLFVGCGSLPKGIDRPVSYAYNDTDDSRLGQRFSAEVQAQSEKSGFLLLESGLDAFVARSVLAQAADHSIDAQYYLFHNDLAGKLFTNQLIKAADRGVRVRLLVDDMALQDGDFRTAVVDQNPNIEVRIINPFFRSQSRLIQYLTRLGSVTRRMHNKSFTVDNQVTILGGRNIGNEYFDANPGFAFSDLDVLAIGPVVRDASDVFDLYWNSTLSYPASALVTRKPTAEEVQQARLKLDDFVMDQEGSEYLQALRSSRLAKDLRNNSVKFEWGEAKIVYDHPDKLVKDRSRTDIHLSSQVKPYFQQLRNELIIISPYFVPGKYGVDSLSRLVESGVRVRILTNSLASTDVSIVHAGYSRYRKSLLRAGIELYELNELLTRSQRKELKGLEGSSKARLHAKSFVLDRERVFIGSLNLDPRSVVENTEIGVVIESSAIAHQMADWFDENIDRVAFQLELTKDYEGIERIVWRSVENGQQKTFNVEPHTGFWRRFGVGLMRLLPMESQL